MSAIHLFLLVGLFSVSYACDKVPAKENIDPSAFFNGTWYITHISRPWPELCMSIKFEFNVFETMVKQTYTYTDAHKTIILEATIDLSSQISWIKLGLGRYFTKNTYSISDADPEIVYYTIIDTDYENYGVIYSCPEDSLDGVFLVLSRTPSSDRIELIVEKVLEKIGQNFSRFSSDKHLNCHDAPSVQSTNPNDEDLKLIKDIFNGT